MKGKKRMTREETNKRNIDILNSYKAGEKVTDLSKSYGLSSAYIYEVLRNTKRLVRKTPRPVGRIGKEPLVANTAPTARPVDNAYLEAATAIANLVTGKQAAYGDSFGRSGVVLREMFPNGVPPEKIDSFLFITRMVDKMFRVANQPDAYGEDPVQDMNGYTLLEMVKRKATKET